MARIRTIKPEFWDSPSVASASPWARLLFIAMWNWADDHGRGTANLKELEGFAFPNDTEFCGSSGNTVHFRDLVAEVADAFGVVFYTVDGRPYFEIPSWDRHQRNERRSKTSKHPSPQVEGAVAEIPCNHTETPRTSGPGTGEQGNRGTGEKNSSSYVSYREAEQNDDDEYPMGLIPDDWTPNDLHRARNPRPDLDEIAEAFREHAVARGRRCHGRAGWDAAFSTWIRKSAPPVTPGVGAATTKAQGWLDIANNLPDDSTEQKAIGQ